MGARALKVGLIGYGYWGANLIALADQSEVRRAAVPPLASGGRVLSSATELLDDPEVEAVVIATPVASHFDLARRAILSGKHVLVEKPMCATSGEGEELVDLAARKGVVLMVDHTYLFTGAVQRIAESVRAGELGKICYYDSMRVNLGLFQPDVNVLWDLAPHDLSIIDHLIDDDPIQVEASGYCHVNQHLPDIVYLTLHYRLPMVAHLNLSWMSPVKVRRVAIGGTDRMLVWDDLDREEKIKVFNSGIRFQPEEERSVIVPDYRIGDIYSPRVPNKEALGGVLEHFARVITGGESCVMGAERGLRIVRILEAAQKALDHSLETVRSAAQRKS